MSKKKTHEEHISERFFELLSNVDIRNAEKGKGYLMNIPTSMRKVIEQDIAELEKIIGIKINLNTYFLICAMLVSQYGQNPKKDFYRLQKVEGLIDHAKAHELELRRKWMEFIKSERRNTK